MQPTASRQGIMKCCRFCLFATWKEESYFELDCVWADLAGKSSAFYRALQQTVLLKNECVLKFQNGRKSTREPFSARKKKYEKWKLYISFPIRWSGSDCVWKYGRGYYGNNIKTYWKSHERKISNFQPILPAGINKIWVLFHWPMRLSFNLCKWNYVTSLWVLISHQTHKAME